MEREKGLDLFKSYPSHVKFMKLTTINLLTDTEIFKQAEKMQTTLDCKFVLLANETENFLIFGSLHSYNYHAKLVEKFCLDRNISSKWQRQPDLYNVDDETLGIKGGGWFKFDFFQKTLLAAGSSTAYGRFDENIFEQFNNNNLIYNNFKINIK